MISNKAYRHRYQKDVAFLVHTQEPVENGVQLHGLWINTTLESHGVIASDTFIIANDQLENWYEVVGVVV